MKMKKNLFVFALMLITLSACGIPAPVVPTFQPTLSPISSPIILSPSTFVKTVTPESTPSPTPSATIVKTMTPESTLSPDEIKKEIALLVQTNGNCNFPCFWGIIPEKTSQTQLDSLLGRLDDEGFLYKDGEHVYESATFSFNKLGIIEFQSDIQNGIVQNIVTTLDGLWHPEITLKDWSVYNLSNVLKTYGPPTSVGVYLSLPYNQVSYGIQMIYKDIDTIILFSGQANSRQNPTDGLYKVCPNAKEIGFVKMQFGKNPINKEPDGLPLSSATSLSVDEFTKLFASGSQAACMTININAFP